jgi:hypothetical protein
MERNNTGMLKTTLAEIWSFQNVKGDFKFSSRIPPHLEEVFCPSVQFAAAS